MSQKPNTAADEVLPEAMHNILKDLANECWREGHNEEPSNEVGYWVKEAASALKIQLQQAITDAERRGRIAGLKSAHRYKGNPFEIGKKIIKEIERLEALQANAGGGERE